MCLTALFGEPSDEEMPCSLLYEILITDFSDFALSIDFLDLILATDFTL